MADSTAAARGSRSTRRKDTQPTKRPSATDNDDNDDDGDGATRIKLSDPKTDRKLASAWFNIPWTIAYSRTEPPQSVPTRVDCQSGYSLINSRLAERLGLKRYPTTTPMILEGFGGGKEIIKEDVWVRTGCQAIGHELKQDSLYIVESDIVPGLLVGTWAIQTYRILEKIVAAKKKYGDIPPGMSMETIMDARDDVVAPIREGPSRGMY